MDRFQAVLIEKARTPKVRELEEELAAEVKESGNIADSQAQNTTQGTVASFSTISHGNRTDQNIGL